MHWFYYVTKSQIKRNIGLSFSKILVWHNCSKFLNPLNFYSCWMNSSCELEVFEGFFFFLSYVVTWLTRECSAKSKEHGCRLALFPKIWVTILRRVSKKDFALPPLSFYSYFIFIYTKCSWNQHKLALLEINLTEN